MTHDEHTAPDRHRRSGALGLRFPRRTRGPVSPPATGASARRRLRRLQIRLTLAYALTTLVGVGALSWLVIRTDARSWESAEYEEMYRRASVSASLLYYDDHGLELDGLHDDEATTGRIQVGVVRAGPDGRLSTVFTSFGTGLSVPAAQSDRIVRSAMRRDTTVRTEGHAHDGRPVYLLALPFYNDETHRTAGAVVTIGGPGQGHAEHRRLETAVLTGSAVLTALAAVAGQLISGRSLRPAWEALEAQERLLADAAHELRTPVAILRGSVDIADRDPQGVERHLPRIRRATDRMADVVDNVLVRGRLRAAPDTYEPVPLRLDQLVEQICDELTPSGAPITQHLHESVVEADPALVRIATRNLLDNALRHGRTPGDPRDRAEVEVTVLGPTIAVADRGPGVATGDLPGLLERFRSPGGGTGIGLALVQEIAAAHGGSITVAQRPGGGAVFALTLRNTVPPRPRPWRLLRLRLPGSRKTHEPGDRMRG
ncbi:sensor histidine kinase [Streptomyces sp. NPDC096198]|uniref:sensor histidine kinase n=1 Tax=Streptomyces sp. NPDC096198 TaxID=3366080 RepID=UPI0038207FB7